MATVIEEREHKKFYRDGNKLIKEFDEAFTKAEVLNEALNTARVEETGLKIPKLLDVRKTENGWAITREYIEGETLSELMKKNPEKEDEYLEKFVDLQLEIHSKKAPHLNKIKDKMHAKISASSYEATLRYDLHNRLEGMKKHTKVLHGDYCPANVIVTPDGEYYIIDWAHATQATPLPTPQEHILPLIFRAKRIWQKNILTFSARRRIFQSSLFSNGCLLLHAAKALRILRAKRSFSILG